MLILYVLFVTIHIMAFCYFFEKFHYPIHLKLIRRVIYVIIMWLLSNIFHFHFIKNYIYLNVVCARNRCIIFQKEKFRGYTELKNDVYVEIVN